MDTYYDYNDEDLMSLCVWREARGEGALGRRGVAHVIYNRANSPCWWGKDVRSVILKPYQFSSFNENDPNSTKFPTQDERDWVEIKLIVKDVLNDTDNDEYCTNGATFYHDTSVGFPATWGQATDFMVTLRVGRLVFYRYKPILSNHNDVQSAANNDN